MSDEQKKSKQAVLIIHGIGEQRPMDTLRRFIEAVWETNEDIHIEGRPAHTYSKPDKISGNLDLRRLTTSYNKANIGTDFFEFYWAHMMDGNKLMHVWGWLKPLLGMGPRKLRYPLSNVWWLLVGIILLTALIVGGLYFLATFLSFPILRWFIYVLMLIVLNKVVNMLNDYGGDAARYLDPSPKNIKQRQNIREAGINIIKSINNSGKYDRITVVGHSLGSVIAYDILSHSWPDFKSNIPSGTHLKKLKTLTDYAKEKGDNFDVDQYQTLQSKALMEQIEKGNKWIISDLITIGSPLTYSDVLLASSKDELNKKLDQKEFPSCPPQLEDDDFIYNTSYDNKKDVRQMTHHSLFAITRWTNIYFPQRKLIFGDIIGGPISNLLGRGIKDIPVPTNVYNKLFSHTKYWDMDKDNAHVKVLREALKLDMRMDVDEKE